MSDNKTYLEDFSLNSDNLFGIDSTNPFGNSDDSYKPTYCEKVLIDNDRVSTIDNYGIYDYFKECEKSPRKMMGFLFNNRYVINIGDGDKYDHYGLGMDISDRYGNSSVSISSYGVEFNAFFNNNVSDDQFYSLECCFRELRDYYVESGKNIRISLIGFNDDRFSKFHDCSNIDDIILELVSLKEEKHKENNTVIADMFF